MSRPSIELTFHRAANTTQPEAFVFEPQRYTRHVGKRSVHEAEFRWDAEMLELLDRLARSSGDADARRRMGARLRDFLIAMAWDIPEDDLCRQPGDGEAPPTLTISAGAAELYTLPWELATLPSSNRYIADLPHALLRYEWPGLQAPTPAAPEPLETIAKSHRVLFAWSAAGGAVPAAEHGHWLERTTARAALTGGVRLDTVDHVSGARLEEALAENRGPTILHILCHSALHSSSESRSAALVWNAGGGGSDEIDTDRLSRLLTRYRDDLRMVLLCACSGGDNDPAGRYVGSLAQGLHRLGIPSVVASRYPLTTGGSTRLTRVLYEHLLVKGAPLENALLAARAALHSERGKATEESAGDEHGCRSEDAYSLQLYARSIEATLDADGRPAHRDVTATYPFGPPARRRRHARATPKYTDKEAQRLSEQIEEERARAENLRRAGRATDEVQAEILRLRRLLREGGQLRAGDSLGEGRYLLLECIGRGGFATVWQAKDRSADRLVAIKVLHANLAGDEARRDRFFRGARIMSELTHPAVVRVLDSYGEDGGFFYFVMEYVQGEDLRHAVLEKRLSRSEVVPLILRVGEALSEAHAKGAVHRDVKPANILLDESKAPRLTDFDLVAVKDTTGGTRTGALGTFVYAAPELMDKPQTADARADIFGLGMTGVFCFHGAELTTMAFRKMERIIEGLPCGPTVRKALGRAVEWEIGDRYADMAAFCEALREAEGEDNPSPPVPSVSLTVSADAPEDSAQMTMSPSDAPSPDLLPASVGGEASQELSGLEALTGDDRASDISALSAPSLPFIEESGEQLDGRIPALSPWAIHLSPQRRVDGMQQKRERHVGWVVPLTAELRRSLASRHAPMSSEERQRYKTFFVLLISLMIVLTGLLLGAIGAASNKSSSPTNQAASNGRAPGAQHRLTSQRVVEGEASLSV